MTSDGSVKGNIESRLTSRRWRQALWSHYTWVIFLLDCILVPSMLTLAFLLRVGVDAIDTHLIVGRFVSTLAIFIALFTANAYSNERAFRDISYAVEHCVALVVAYFVMVAVVELTGIDAVAGPSSRVATLLGFVMAALSTLFARRWIYQLVVPEFRARTIGVLGDAGSIRQLAKELELAQDHRGIVAIVPSGTDSDLPAGCDVRRTDNVVEAVRALPETCDTIIVTGGYDQFDQPLLGALVERYLTGVTVLELDRFYEHRFNRVWLASVTGAWLLDGELALRRSLISAQVKRLVDISASLFLMLLLSPMIMAIGLCIAIDTRGPVLYRQRRMGLDGVPFTILKFRTMVPGSDRTDPYTQANDTRLTAVGRLIRRPRLDELPQLWNVLRGEMSLVGPRAESLDLVEQYEKSIPFYHFRHVVRPGITGLAQVEQGYVSNQEEAVRKLEYDLYYVRNFNVRLDLRILFRTLRVVARGDGR